MTQINPVWVINYLRNAVAWEWINSLRHVDVENLSRRMSKVPIASDRIDLIMDYWGYKTNNLTASTPIVQMIKLGFYTCMLVTVSQGKGSINLFGTWRLDAFNGMWETLNLIGYLVAGRTRSPINKRTFSNHFYQIEYKLEAPHDHDQIGPNVFKRWWTTGLVSPATLVDRLINKVFSQATNKCHVKLGNFICGRYGHGDKWWKSLNWRTTKICL